MMKVEPILVVEMELVVLAIVEVVVEVSQQVVQMLKIWFLQLCHQSPIGGEVGWWGYRNSNAENKRWVQGKRGGGLLIVYGKNVRWYSVHGKVFLVFGVKKMQLIHIEVLWQVEEEQ